MEESLPLSSITGQIFDTSSNSGVITSRLLAFIQLTLPRMVLISPLCTRKRLGCARSQLGKVLVENRECTMASAV